MKTNEHMKLERVRRGLSVKKLSQASGVSTSCIDGIEAGKHSPTLFNLILICKALGTTVDGYVGVDYDN